MVTSLHHYGNMSHLRLVSPNHNVLYSPPSSCSVLFVPLAVVVWDPEAIGIITQHYYHTLYANQHIQS